MKGLHKNDRGYIGGYFTVEAAFVFPIMLMVIAAVLRLGMEVHDNMVDMALAQYLYIKEKSIEQNCYNPYEQKTDLKECVNTAVVEAVSIHKEVNKLYAEEMVREYGKNIMLYKDEISDIGTDKKLGLKNSTIVRVVNVIKVRTERTKEND